ncbi:uncharacterized protein LOC109726155 isoform X2 [Ananas comosus]|uniref:Uncharacterized protein LOC109726155 isoform X2 n=1 Tax=Ananas comosus TaxID=4615 RepID=A0A6P5GTG8_ANACO|nr:uncharacterized protein LOC109726155 isoform X2 [Ananas comosus]
MACRTLTTRSLLLLSDPSWRLSPRSPPPHLLLLRSRVRVPRSGSAAAAAPLRCSYGGEAAPSSSSSPAPNPDEQGPPQEAVLKAISVSKSEGRVAQTTNVVIGGTVTDDATDEWIVLDQKVNSYPMVRGFTAIGTGGDDFVRAMVVAVESVLQEPIPKGQVSQKLSSRGKYVSVNIGPIRVVSSEQVQAVYNAMRRDDRMKYFL